MGIGAISIVTSQKREPSGSPFTPGSAYNGVSIDATGRVVLGNDLGGTTAQLISSREIPLNGSNIAFTGSGFIGINRNVPTHKLEIATTDLMQAANGITELVIADGSYDTSTGPKMNIGIQGDSSAFRAVGGFQLVNVGVLGLAENGDANHGIGTGSVGFNGFGYFSQIGNFTTRLEGGPASENFTFGPTNEIFVNANRFTVNSRMGIQVSASGAFLEITPGTAVEAPLKFQAGVVLTVPVDGSFEYNGTNLFFDIGATRNAVFAGNDGAAAPGTTPGVVITNFYGTSATNYLGDPNNWASVVINGVTYKIPLYT